MTKKWEGLVNTIQRFQSSVKSELDKVNSDFHHAINGESPLSIKGLEAIDGERNEYLIDLSDILFWHDPIAYIDEIEQWKNRKAHNKYAEVREYLKKSDQVNLFNRLVKAIKRKRISPFVGAGLSAPYGFPLWGEALSRLVIQLEGDSASDHYGSPVGLTYLDDVKKHLDQYEYILAAQLIYERHKSYLESFVMNTFDGADTADIQGVVALLPKLTDGCIITTNFDRLIETAFLRSNKAIEGYMHGTQSQNQFASNLIQGERCILKLHGDHSSSDTYIFSKSQYDAAYGINNKPDYKKPLAKALRQVFISHSLVFLGCSLEEDRTLELFIDVVESNAFDIPSHFAFLPDVIEHEKKLGKQELLMKAKIQPIWYTVKAQSDGGKDHFQLNELLALAIDCASGKISI